MPRRTMDGYAPGRISVFTAIVVFLISVQTAVAQGQLDQKGQDGCSTCDIAGIDANATPTLIIRWKRLVDQAGLTATIHASAETEVDRACATLKSSLESLGVKVVLQKASISLEEFQQNPLDSNRIWLNGKALELYLPDTKTGQFEEKQSRIVFRTVSFGGRSFVNVPAKMIEQAGMLAASDSIKQTMADQHAIGLVASRRKVGSAASGTSCCEGGGTGSCSQPDPQQPPIVKKKVDEGR